MDRTEETREPECLRPEDKASLPLPPGRGFKGAVLLFDRNGVHAMNPSDGEGPLFVPLDAGGGDGSPFPEALAEAAAQALARFRLRPARTLVVLPHSLCSLDILSFPPVDRKHLIKIMGRKVERAAASEGGQGVAWTWRLLEKDRNAEGGGETRVLLTRVQDALLQRIQKALLARGIRRPAILPSIARSMALVETLHEKTAREAVMAVDLSAEGALISVFKGRALRQVRLVKCSVEGTPQAFASFLRDEIRRSITFYKEKFNARGMDGLLLLGPGARAIFPPGVVPPAPLIEPSPPWKTGVQDDEKGSLTPVPDEGLLLSFAGAFLAAGVRTRNTFFAGYGEGRIMDFAPSSRRKKSLVAAAAVMLLFLAGTGVLFLGHGLEARAEKMQQESRDLETSLKPLQEKAERYEALSRLHASLRELEAFLRESTVNRTRVGGALAAIRSTLPEDVSLLSLRYDTGATGTEQEGGDAAASGKGPLPEVGGKIFVELQGNFTAGRGRALRRFLAALDRSTFFTKISCSAGEAKTEGNRTARMREAVNLELVLR